jgi:NarL family two-component system response regulator LiaR
MDNSSRIRVMLVDDHAVVRSGLRAFLLAYDEFELVAEAADGAKAVRLCERMRPDVILMDLLMPGMDGATATRAIRTQYPQIQVLILTSFAENNRVQDALSAGAIGYLLKNVSAEELATAICAAYRGRPTLAPEATQALIQAMRSPDTAKLGHDLTARERDVLALLVKGLDNTVIAETLIISRSTAKFHVTNILSKLQAINRTEAVAMALQANLVPKLN